MRLYIDQIGKRKESSVQPDFAFKSITGSEAQRKIIMEELKQEKST